MQLRNRILDAFREHRELSLLELSELLKASPKDIARELKTLQQFGMIQKLGRSKWVAVRIPPKTKANPLIPSNILYNDWQNVVSRLVHCYKQKIPVLLIGPKGVGKTRAIMKCAELVQKPLRTVNGSLRTREHHIIGRLDTDSEGKLYFKPGPLVLSMQEGGIFYIDELNVFEPDVLIRLDEAFDDRRQINVEGELIRAHPDWWFVGSINPLDRFHPGTKELPGQILSRFPVRIKMDFPDPKTEYEIIKLHVRGAKRYSTVIYDVLGLINQLREAELPYTPSIRESIAFARLLVSGIRFEKAVEMTLLDVYIQWGPTVYNQVKELILSRLEVNFE